MNDNMDFVMQLRIDTNNALGGINDVWSELRRMANRQVNINLTANPDFRAARQELERLDKQIDDMQKNLGQAEKKGVELGNKIEASMRQINGAAKGMGNEIKKAFDEGGIDAAKKKVQELTQMFKGLQLAAAQGKNGSKGALALDLEKSLTKVLKGTKSEQLDPQIADILNQHLEKAFRTIGRLGRETDQKKADKLEMKLQETIDLAKSAAEGFEGLAGGKGAKGYISMFEGILEIEKTIANIDRMVKHFDSTGQAGASKTAATARDFVKGLGVSFKGALNNGYEGLETQANQAREFMMKVVNDGIENAMEDIGKGFVDALEEKKNLITPAQERAMYDSAVKNFGEVNKQLLNITMMAAKESLGPMMKTVLGEGMGGLMHGLAGGGGGANVAQMVAALRAAGGATGGGKGVEIGDAGIGVLVRANKKELINSIIGILRGKNEAERGWPLLNVKASEKAVVSSIIAALRKFNRSEDAPILKLKGEVDAPGRGIRVTLNKENLVRQIQQAFNETSGTLRIKGVKVEADGSLVSVAAQNRKKKAAEPEATPEELMAAHGLNMIRKSRLTQAERDHNTRVSKMRTIRRASNTVNIGADPIAALSGFDPALADRAKKIKQALDFVPSAANPNSADQKVKMMKDAEQEWVNLSAELKHLAERLAKDTKQDVGKLESVAMIHTALNQQLGSRVGSFGRNRANMNVRAGMSAAEEARQTYLQNVPVFSRAIYQEVYDAPFNRHAEQFAAYKRSLDLVRQYEKEFLAYTHARNEQDQAGARNRLNATGRELEMTKDLLHLRLLFGQKGTYNVREFSPEFRADANGSLYRQMTLTGQRRMVNPMEAYDRTSTVLREQFMPAIEEFNKAQFEAKQKLLADARTLEMQGNIPGAYTKYDEARGLTDTNFEELIAHMTGKTPMTGSRYDALVGSVQRSMRMTPQEEAQIATIMGQQVSEQQKMQMIMTETKRMAEQRLTSFVEEANVLQHTNGLLEVQREKMVMLARYDDYRKNKQHDPYGFVRAGRGLSNTLGFYAGGMMLGFAAQNALRNSFQYEETIKEIQGVLGSKSPSEAQLISQSVGSTAMKYGADLNQTAEAARTLAQAGLSANEVMRELDYTMRGMRGLGMTIDQMNELQISIRAVDESITSSALLEKISKVEASYAVSAQGLADALKISAPFIKQFTEGMRGKEDFVDVTNGMVTTIVEKLRVSGSQAGNSLKFMFARLLRPELLTKLQTEFGLKLGTEEGGMLPIDQLFGQVARRYNDLKSSNKRGDSVRADQMISQLAGSHRVNYLAALLTDYDRAMRIATESSNAFGEAQERSDIAMESTQNKMNKVKNSFQLFTNQMTQGTLVAEGFRATLDGLAAVLGGVGGQGGGLGTLLALTVGGFAAGKKVKNIYDDLSIKRDAGIIGVDPESLLAAEKERRKMDIRNRYGPALNTPQPATTAVLPTTMLGRVGAGMTSMWKGITGAFGSLVNYIGPTGVILTGLTLFTAGLGVLRKMFYGAADDAKQYGVKLKSDSELRMYDSPQFKNLEETSRTLGYSTGYQGYNAFRSAILDPRTLAAAQAAAGTRGDYASIMQGISRGDIKDGPKVAKAIMDAISTSPLLTEDARTKLAQFNTEAEKFAFVSRAMGEAAFAATYRMQQAMSLMRDSVTRQLETMNSGLQQADVRNRVNGVMKVLGGLRDFFTNRLTLNTQVGLFRDFTKKGDVNNYALRLSQKEISNDIKGFFKDANVPTKITEAFFEEGSVFSRALGLAAKKFQELGDNTVKVADLLALTIKIIDKASTGFEYGEAELDKDGKGYHRVSKTGSAMDALAAQIGAAALGQTGFEDLARTIMPGMTAASAEKPAEDKFFDFINNLDRKVQEYVERNGLVYAQANNKSGVEIQSAADIAKNMKAVTLTLLAGADALLVFKNRMLELVSALYMEVERAKAEDLFANKFGESNNPYQRAMGIDKQFFIQAATLRAQANVDIMKKRAEYENLQLLQTKGKIDENGNFLSPDASKDDIAQASARVQARLYKMRAEIEKMTEMADEAFGKDAMTIANALPDGPQKQEVLKSLQFLMQNRGHIGSVKFNEGLQNVLGNHYQTMQQEELNKRTLPLQNSAMEVKAMERMADLKRQAVDTEVDLGKRYRERMSIETEIYQQRLKDMNLQFQLGEMSYPQFVQKKAELANEIAINMEYERRQTLLTAQLDLQKQGLDTMRATIDGSMKAFTDMGAFGAIFSGKGSERSAALRQYVLNNAKAISSPVNERFGQNLMSSLYDMAARKDSLKELFQRPEFAMKDKIEEAGTIVASNFHASIYEPGMAVAKAFRDSIQQAGEAVTTSPLATGPASVDDILKRGVPGIQVIPSAPDKISGPTSAAALPSTGKGDRMKLAIANLAGQFIGTAVGGGGQGAQIGSEFGSVLGTIFGGPVGGIFGGAAGGFIGKLFDHKESAPPVINHLEAIEFNTRDTITAIEQQTDKLLAPNAGIFGLPTNFSIPGYTPEFTSVGGGSVRGGDSYKVDVGGIVINGDADPKDIQRVVEQAVADALDGARTTRARTNRRF